MIIRSKRKTLAMQINEQAQLIIRAPYHVSMKKINSFIVDKSNWIQKKQNQMTQRNELIEQSKEFKDGKRIMYLGSEYEVRINGKIKSIELNENYMEFPFKYIDSADEALIKWYKKKAREIIIPRAASLAQKLSLDFNKISITSAKKRWGSCNSKGNINFSYRLIMTPTDIIDYVIVHELMHLIELNHSSKFWDKVASIMPSYKTYKKWLRDNQQKFLI